MDAKPLREDLQSLGFTPSLAKPEKGERSLKDEELIHKMAERNESG